MRFCDECGAKLDDNASFCDECGAKLETRIEEAPIATGGIENATKKGGKAKKTRENNNSVTVGEKQVSSSRNGGNSAKILVIILTLLLCAAMVVIFVLLKDRGAGNSDNNGASPNATQIIQSTENVQPTEEVSATPEPATKKPVAKTQAPVTKEPATKEPVAETQAPITKDPATKAPATKVPTTKAPATKVPTTKAPATKTPKKTKVVLASKVTYDSYNNLEETREYTYDKKGRLISEKRKIEDHYSEPGFYEYKYNKLGQVSEYTRSDLEGTYLYQVYYEYKYDADGRVILETYYAVDEEDYFDYEMEGHIEYTYDNKGNLTEKYMITNGRYLGTYTYDNTYNEDGLIISKTSYLSDDWEFMNFVAGVSYTYDAKNRLVKEEEISNGVVLLRRNITYDKNGNIMKENIYDGISEEQTIIKYEYKTIEVD